VEPLAPLPDGVPSPAAWGRQEVMQRRLGALLEGLELRTRTLTIRFPDADSLFAALVRPTPLGEADRRLLRPDFDRLLASCNDSPPAAELSARYLVAVGRRPT